MIFRAGDLVQVYRSDLDYMFKTDRKLLPKFSVPRQVVSRTKNSYQLETLEGLPISSRFSSQRLWLFIPRKGTELDMVQVRIEKEWRERENMEDRVEREGEDMHGNKESDEEINHLDKHPNHWTFMDIMESQSTGVACVVVAVGVCNKDIA